MEKRISLLNSASQYLSQTGVGNSLQEAEFFLSHVLGCQRIELYLDNLHVPEDNRQRFWQMINSRGTGFPLQYILGYTEFMGIKFKVRPGVFLPRPETEILVEETLKQSADISWPSAKVLDIGTGCGNIAISIAKHTGNMHIFACDICQSALQLAKENARAHKVNISLIKSDIYSAFKKEQFSLIISNPPYICADDIDSLRKEIGYEPRAALDAGKDGLLYYRRIIKDAATYLKKGGVLALEIGDDQYDAIERIFAHAGAFDDLSKFKDYNGVDRVICAHKRY